jgi:hypothetical protein
MADEQNVYITGAAGGLADWAKEGTQSAIAQSLKQIQADNNQMLRFLHKIANGEKTSAAHLAKLGAEIKQTRQTTATAADQAGARDTKKASTNRGIIENGRAVVAALTGLRSDTQNETRHAQKREATYRQLLNQGFGETAANAGANASASMSRHEKLLERTAAFAAGLMTLSTVSASATQEGYNERYAMVSELRQAGLLASVKKTEQGFINISNVISEAGFTFAEASDFVQHFSKVVGVVGVKSAMKFSQKIASSPDIIQDGMDLMRRYTMNFTQVAKMSGDYLDALRVAGQLQGRSDDELYSGMSDFMTNVEMTSNVLKISMTDAAELMKNSLKSEDVALLSTLPEEQRKAIENGFLAMGANAQGNPMAETLAARLSAGGSAQFLQTAEYQQMAGTSVGREVLQFVEKMAQELEGGTSESFSAALADQFPKFADQLTEMASQGGVRVQLLSDKQLAGMVGSIITAAQNFGDADKGQAQGGALTEDTAAQQKQEQQRLAQVLSENAFTTYMDSFTTNLEKLTISHRDFANRAAEMMIAYEPVFAMFTNIGTGLGEVGTDFMSWLMKTLTPGSDSNERMMDELRGGMEKYQPDSKRGLGKSYLGLNQTDRDANNEFIANSKTFLGQAKSGLTDLKSVDLSTIGKIQAKENLAKTEQQIADLGAQMLSVFNLIKSDDGSRSDDQTLATQIIDMRAVLNSLNTLSAQLNNIITN